MRKVLIIKQENGKYKIPKLLRYRLWNHDFKFEYVGSLFSMKPILMASEIDDSRPTVIREFHKNPTFISVLSGKINTVYDLDEVLKNGRE